MIKPYLNTIKRIMAASIILAASILLFAVAASALETLNAVTFTGYHASETISDIKPVMCKDNVVFLTCGFDLLGLFPVSKELEYLTIGCSFQIENPDLFNATVENPTPWISLADHVRCPAASINGSNNMAGAEEETYFAKLNGSLKLLDATDLSLDFAAGLNLNTIKPLSIYTGCFWKPLHFISIGAGLNQDIIGNDGMLGYTYYASGQVGINLNGVDFKYSYKGDNTHTFSVSISPDIFEPKIVNHSEVASL